MNEWVLDIPVGTNVVIELIEGMSEGTWCQRDNFVFVPYKKSVYDADTLFDVTMDPGIPCYLAVFEVDKRTMTARRVQ